MHLWILNSLETAGSRQPTVWNKNVRLQIIHYWGTFPIRPQASRQSNFYFNGTYSVELAFLQNPIHFIFVCFWNTTLRPFLPMRCYSCGHIFIQILNCLGFFPLLFLRGSYSCKEFPCFNCILFYIGLSATIKRDKQKTPNKTPKQTTKPNQPSKSKNQKPTHTHKKTHITKNPQRTKKKLSKEPW